MWTLYIPTSQSLFVKSYFVCGLLLSVYSSCILSQIPRRQFLRARANSLVVTVLQDSTGGVLPSYIRSWCRSRFPLRAHILRFLAPAICQILERSPWGLSSISQSCGKVFCTRKPSFCAMFQRISSTTSCSSYSLVCGMYLSWPGYSFPNPPTTSCL